MNVYLDNNLIAYGYQRVKLTINNGAVFAKTAGTHASVLLYIQEPVGMRGSMEQFASVRTAVIDAFHRSGFTETRILTLIESWRVPELAGEQEKLAPVWFIEEASQKLMIYENAVADFDGLQAVVERSLAQMQPRREAYGTSGYGAPYGSSPVSKRKSPRTFREFVAHQGPCNLSIVGINILVFLAMEIIGSTTDAYFMATHGAVYTPWVLQGDVYTLFTSMFLHFGFAHLFGNMLVLFFLGDNLERAVGHVKYLIIYLGAGLAGGLISCGIELLTRSFSISAGASGAIFGVLGALFVIVRRNRNKLEDLSTPKLVLFIAYTLYSGFTSSGVDNAAHVGGLLAGALLAALLYKKNNKNTQ